MEGNWKEAKKYFGNADDMNRVINPSQSETTLHIATLARQERFVKKLVRKLKPEDLEAANSLSNNALNYAAVSGNVNIAKFLVNAGTERLRYPNTETPPLVMASSFSNPNMIRYLFAKTDVRYGNWTVDQQAELFHNCMAVGLYDVALKMLDMQIPNLATTRNKNNETALHVLARTPSAFGNESEPAGLLKRFLSSSIELVEKLLKYSHHGKNQITSSTTFFQELLFAAAEEGNVDFIIILFHLDPNLLFTRHNEYGSIFHVAVRQRHEKIFNLLSELGTFKNFMAVRITEVGENSLLHLAATLAPQDKLDTVRGAALQMHRELLWFKEVEKIVPISYRYIKNSEGDTPREIFAKTHQGLREKGEKWMKDTAKSSMVVATLIATVMFASALSVPGGFNQSGGTAAGQPVLLEDKAFTVFWISVAISVLTSSASILMFLSILTSRYAEKDFLKSVPVKMLIGLTSLFVSIASMMVAFSTTFILYHIALASISLVFIFVPFIYILLMYSLLVDLIQSLQGHLYVS
ncbi:hypothetical protein FNV43_RR00703 [Rhamnella rubrinervis]|uniref:PGG domain-containing protein n=1 Tax=Rhamnella rubrinervis TaxID=2594499 RepID=A0A8K0HQW5_9ROSA|nr:hypothetical protein FNV43_RR00703 [Rhamnella rubrinervis]